MEWFTSRLMFPQHFLFYKLVPLVFPWLNRNMVNVFYFLIDYSLWFMAISRVFESAGGGREDVCLNLYITKFTKCSFVTLHQFIKLLLFQNAIPATCNLKQMAYVNHASILFTLSLYLHNQLQIISFWWRIHSLKSSSMILKWII